MCYVDFDDGESATVWNETAVKAARKDHTCDCCHGTIRKGDGYVRHFYVCDGSPSDEKMCGPCGEVLARFAAEHDGYRYVPSYFAEALAGCISEGDGESARWQADLDAMRARRAPTRGER